MLFIRFFRYYTSFNKELNTDLRLEIKLLGRFCDLVLLISVLLELIHALLSGYVGCLLDRILKTIVILVFVVRFVCCLQR